MVAAMSGCGYDRYGDMERVETALPLPNAPIAYLRRCADEGRGRPEDGMVLAGYVTSSDREGNFYRSFFVQDYSGAAEIKAGLWNLYNTYQPGRRVVVKCSGLAVGLYEDVVQLGMIPDDWDYRAVSEFGSAVLLDDYVIRDTVFGMPAPVEVWKAAELKPEMCGMLVRMNSVSLGRDTLLSWAAGPGDGIVPFADCKGDSIRVITGPYAHFASDAVPCGSVSLTGILLRRGEKYMLKLRDLNDVEIL